MMGREVGTIDCELRTLATTRGPCCGRDCSLSARQVDVLLDERIVATALEKLRHVGSVLRGRIGRRGKKGKGWGMKHDSNDLARALASLALDPQSRPDEDSTLRLIVDGAVRLVPGARWAGISEVSDEVVEPRVPTDPIVGKLDALQTELDDGPCITALRQHQTVLIKP